MILQEPELMVSVYRPTVFCVPDASTPLGHASQRMAAIHDSPVVLVLSELGHALPTDLVCQL